jgi:hypothetical protein
MKTNTMKKNQGSVIIYIVLLIFLLMTSAAIVLSSILSKHIKTSENYLRSEQAFAAANSSIELMLYEVIQDGKLAKEDITGDGTIDYDGYSVEFTGSGCGRVDAGILTAHISAAGVYKDLVRRIDFGGGSGGC